MNLFIIELILSLMYTKRKKYSCDHVLCFKDDNGKNDMCYNSVHGLNLASVKSIAGNSTANYNVMI